MDRSPIPQPHDPAGTAAQAGPDPLPDGPALVLRDHTGPEHAVVAVEGSVDYHTAPQLQGHLGTPELQRVPLLVVDLSRVEFCDSSALGAFVQVFQRRAAAGHRFALAGPQPDVRRTLELTQLTKLLPVHPTVSDALAET